MSDKTTAKDKENPESSDNAEHIRLNLRSYEKKSAIDPPEEPMDHDDVTFYFFHGLAEKMILKRNDVGGKKHFNNILVLVSTLKTIEICRRVVE